MILAFSFFGQTALIQNNTEQSVRFSVARIACEYLSSGRFRLFEATCLNQVCRLGKFSVLAKASFLSLRTQFVAI